MGDPSETEIQLRQRALGLLAGGIAHDLNNALQTIVGALSTIERLIEMDQLERAPRFIAAAMRSAQRSGELTRHLQRLARRTREGSTGVELNSLIRSLEELFRRICAEPITLQLHLAEAPSEVDCDPGELETVLLTLVINAAAAITGTGEIRISTRDAEVEITASQTFDGDCAKEFAGRNGGRASIEGATVCVYLPRNGGLS